MKEVVPCVFEKQILKTDHNNMYIQQSKRIIDEMSLNDMWTDYINTLLEIWEIYGYFSTFRAVKQNKLHDFYSARELYNSMTATAW
jgi:hypothetical protein